MKSNFQQYFPCNPYSTCMTRSAKRLRPALNLRCGANIHSPPVKTSTATLFNDLYVFIRSDSVWAAETKNLIPTGKLHLSSVDLLEVATKTSSSFNNCKHTHIRYLERAY